MFRPFEGQAGPSGPNPPYGGTRPPKTNAPTPTWWIPLVGAFFILVFVPTIFYGVQRSMPGTFFLFSGTVLALLLVALGLIGLQINVKPTGDPGVPAPFGAPPFGLAGGSTGGLRERLDAVPAERARMHRAVIWGSVAIISIAALMVIAGIIVGPEGVTAVTAGLGVMGGAVFLLAAHASASYRALLPAAFGLFLWGLLIEVQAVADAWGWSRAWNAWWLVLLAPFVSVQALAVEAAFRRGRGVFWSLWAAIGILLGSAYPVWLFLGEPGSSGLPIASTLASLVWGVAAVFAFVPSVPVVRRVGVAVFALWSASLILAYWWQTDLAARLQAAGLVAAAAVATVAFLTYLLKPSATPQRAA